MVGNWIRPVRGAEPFKGRQAQVPLLSGPSPLRAANNKQSIGPWNIRGGGGVYDRRAPEAWVHGTVVLPAACPDIHTSVRGRQAPRPVQVGSQQAAA